ncbi:MAG: long-chain fatty acid--CoA ligase [Pseudomonadota bacterium]
MNFGQWPQKWAQLSPSREAIKYGDLTLTWRRFNERVNQAAQALQANGLKKGDRVAVLMGNNNQYLEIMFALAKTGGMMTPLNFRLSVPELQFIINDCTPAALVYSPEFTEVVRGLRGLCPSLHAFICETAGSALGDPDYESWIGGRSVEEPVPDEEVGLDDTVIIMYTSGTTGRPKGARLLHQNMIWNGVNSQVVNAYTQDDVSLCSAPMFHIGAMNVSVTPMLYAGGKVVVQRFFDPGGALKLLAGEKASLMFGVPVMFQFMTMVPEWQAADFSHLRFFVAGGAPCSRDLIKTYLAKDAHFVQGYGMTETAAGLSLLTAAHALDKIGSAGQPLFHAELKIVDLQGNGLGPNQVGEIIAKGPNIIREYWNLPEETSRNFHDGWLHTGDMGYLDEDGFLYITDRKKDMYISGGENVYPAEVESILLGFPQITEVAVIGVPDDKWGETGLAIVTPASGVEFSEEAFFAYCKENLAGYKRPRKVIVSDKPLPRTATGKLIKKDLRKTHG